MVGADGRHSIVRDEAGFKVHGLGAPMDVLWFSLSHRPSDPADDRWGASSNGSMFVMLDRGDYWQCAYVIPKGSADAVRAGRHREDSAPPSRG